MQSTNTIEIHKSRNISEIINVTFYFIRQNFKNILKCLLYFVMPFYLGANIINITFTGMIPSAALSAFTVFIFPCLDKNSIKSKILQVIF